MAYMSNRVLITDLRTLAASHQKDGERRTAHYLSLAADRIEALTREGPDESQTEHDLKAAHDGLGSVQDIK